MRNPSGAADRQRGGNAPRRALPAARPNRAHLGRHAGRLPGAEHCTGAEDSDCLQIVVAAARYCLYSVFLSGCWSACESIYAIRLGGDF